MRNKGSILIWTMFVSLFIASFFVVYQGSFLNYAKTSEIEGDRLETGISLDEKLALLPGDPVANVSMGKMSLRSVDYDGISFRKKLSGDKSTSFRISSTGGTDILPVKMNSGGPIIYETISYNTSLPSSAAVYDSGVIDISADGNIKLDATKEMNIIGVRALGGMADFSIQRKSTDMTPPDSIYGLYQDFSTWSRFIRNIEIVNYDFASLPIDYTEFGVFLNSTNHGE